MLIISGRLRESKNKGTFIKVAHCATMIISLFIVYLVHCTRADESTIIIPSCSDDPGSRMSFTPVEGFLGRYRADYCTANNNISGVWLLKLEYFHSRNYCNSTHVVASGSSHSTNSEFISKEHNCTAQQTVCMSAIFDLIFSACYSLASSFADVRAAPYVSYFNITNNYTKEFFHNNHAIVDPVYHPEDTTITWHTGVPILEYKMEICNQTELNECEVVPHRNCSMSDPTTLRCRLAAARGCHRLYLAHWAPWITGLYANQSSVVYDFCRNGTSVAPPPDGAWRGWAWAAAGAGALAAAAALAARCLTRALARGKLKKKVHASWLIHTQRREEAVAPAPAAAPAPARSVLVLYARECAAAERAVAALVAALRDHVSGQVYDIFSASVTAQCAAAPGAWVRGVLARADCAVLLLQSPALRALCAAPAHDDHAHNPVCPLLARAPQFGDVLLRLALRLLTEDAHAHHDYNKYYIATLSALPTELVPRVVPYRRYALPAAAGALLRDVTGRAAAPRHLARLARALDELRDYAQDNPHYLMDDLVATLDT